MDGDPFDLNNQKRDEEQSSLMKQRGEGQDVPYVPAKYMTPDEKNEKILKLYFGGMTDPVDIADELNLYPPEVRGFIARSQARKKAEAIKETLTKAVFDKKLPVIKEIVGVSLTGVLEWVEGFVSSEKHLKMSVHQARTFAGLMKDVYEMSRLELGKSTHNVAIVQKVEKDVNVVLDKLRAEPERGGDPFVDYPEDVVDVEYEEATTE